MWKLIHLHCEDVVKLEQHLMESHGFQMDRAGQFFTESARTAGNPKQFISKENKQIIIIEEKEQSNEKMDHSRWRSCWES